MAPSVEWIYLYPITACGDVVRKCCNIVLSLFYVCKSMKPLPFWWREDAIQSLISCFNYPVILYFNLPLKIIPIHSYSWLLQFLLRFCTPSPYLLPVWLLDRVIKLLSLRLSLSPGDPHPLTATGWLHIEVSPSLLLSAFVALSTKMTSVSRPLVQYKALKIPYVVYCRSLKAFSFFHLSIAFFHLPFLNSLTLNTFFVHLTVLS